MVASHSRVLIVDDGIEARERLCALVLEQVATAQVVGCRRSDAMEKASTLDPDCVVVDLPAHDPAAFELVEVLHQRVPPTRLLVVLTNQRSAELAARSLAAGAHHFLDKTMEFERVVELVRALSGDP